MFAPMIRGETQEATTLPFRKPYRVPVRFLVNGVTLAVCCLGDETFLLNEATGERFTAIRCAFASWDGEAEGDLLQLAYPGSRQDRL